MPDDSDALRSDAEGEAAILRGIVANFSQHTWVHHATTKQLYPASVFTGAASLASTDGTIHVHLRAWLREWEVAATEAHLPPLAEKCAGKPLQAALEVAHCTILVDQQSLDLVEYGFVRGIDSLIAVDFARGDDAHRRAHLLHGANLHRRGLRA